MEKANSLHKLLTIALIPVIVVIISVIFGNTSSFGQIDSDDNFTQLNESSNYTTYQDPTYNYEIEYPANLVSDIASMDDNYLSADAGNAVSRPGVEETLMMVIFDPSDLQLANPFPSLIFVKPYHQTETDRLNYAENFIGSDPPKEFTIEDLVSSIQETLTFHKFILMNFEPLANDIGELNGFPAVNIEYKYFNQVYGQPVHQREVYVLANDTLFIFEFLATDSKYAKYITTFDDILSSFKFLG